MKKLKVVVLLLIVLLVGCNNINWKKTEDSLKFKEEYESLNDEKNINGNKYLNLEIPSSNPFKYLTVDEVIRFLEDGTGIIYFGMPTCPYCRSTLEPLLSFAKKNNIQTINYFNPEIIRKDNNYEYQKIVELLKDFLKTDEVNQSKEESDFDSELKRLLVPDVYFVNKGEVISHYAEAGYKTKLDKEQLNKTIKKYQSAYDDYVAVQSMCDEGC